MFLYNIQMKIPCTEANNVLICNQENNDEVLIEENIVSYKEKMEMVLN